MAYTSNSEFDLETRVQITNETPTLRSYQQMHHSLQNDTWKWLIGTEDVSYDLSVGGKYVTITDDDGNEVQSEVQEPPVKIVNGKQAPVYGPSVYKEWDPDSEAYTEITPTYHRMEINGTLSVEQDLFLHEIYRYLNCIYPDHPDWLNLLTRNEIIDAFNNAAAMVDYKPNNEFFKLVADSIDSTESDVEEFKLNLRNLTSNSARRKFYGSTLGYRMMGHGSYENIMVFPIGKNLALTAQDLEERTTLKNDGTLDVKKYIIDTFDERYQTLFRRIDWLGENRDTSFISSNGYSYSTFIIPGYESFAFEFVSSVDGEYTASDYKLYNDSSYSFYTFDDGDSTIIGSISGTNIFNVLEPTLSDDADKVSYTSSDDKLYATRTSANNSVQYFELYKFKPFEEYEEFIRQYSLDSVITYWGDQYNEDGTTSSYTTRSWLNNYLDKLFVVCSSYEVLKDNSSIYDKVQFLYNPFVKNTIMFPIDQMIALYDTETDFDGTDVVPKDSISLSGAALEEGDLISFRDFSSISDGVVYGVAGASYGYIKFTFPGNLEVDDYNKVVAYKPFDVSDDTIVSKEYMSVIIKNSNGDYVEFQGSMQCDWAVKRDGVKVASYLDTATFFIRAIPDTKSDTLFTLLYGTDAADTIESIEESIEDNKKALAKAKALIEQELNKDLYGTPLDTYEELSAKDSLTDEEKEELANAISILETYTYSYWQDYKEAEEAIAEDKEDLETAQEEYNNLKKNRELLLDDDVLTTGYDSTLTKIYVIGAGDTYSSMEWMLEEGSVTEFSLGNISVIPVIAGENYCLPDWHTFTNNNNNNKDYCLVKLDYESVPRDSTYYQLYSEMYDTDRATAFVPSATTSIYNEKTYTIEAQVYVDKEVGTTTNEMQFLTEDAKKKFDSICVGSKVTGPGISSDTYVTSLSNNSLTISTTLPNKGYFIYKFECPVTTSPEEIDDPFNYKKVMNTFGNYDKVSFFDHGVYGTSEWPNVSSVVFDGDLKDKQIIAPDNFLKVVKKLYEDKLEYDDDGNNTNILVPSIGKYTRDVFIDIKADRLISVSNKVGDTNNLMNVEWLDYIQNNSELALAKENINVGANIILNADTSGYASLLQDSYYTDANLQTLFQTLNWNDSTIPAYVQLGTGGSNFSDFWKLISNIYYPSVYGATFYDRLVQPEEGAGNDEDNVTDWREVDETSLSKRSTYAKVGKISSRIEAYSSYENIDNPIFEIPLNEYNINLKTHQNNKTYTTIDALFYEQGFKNLTTEKELKIAKSTDLSTSFIKNYQSVSSLSSPIADSIKYYYLADGDTTGESKADFYFTLYDTVNAEHSTRWEQYEIYNGGTIGANIYYFNNSFYSIVNSLFSDITYSQYKDKCTTDMINDPEEVLRQILLLTTYYYSSNENVNNGLTLKNKFLQGYDLTEESDIENDVVIDNSWFENKLILFSYIKGNWDKTSYDTNEDGMTVDSNGDIIYYDKYQEAAESLEDYFGLKDFDTIGLLWNGEKSQLVYINKNYTICTTDSIKNLALLTQNQYNIFYGYSSYSIFSTYGKAAVEYREKFPGLENEEDPTKWAAVSNDLSDYYMDISNSFIKYTSSIYNIIDLPRKYITEGSYELNLFIDPQFIGEGYLYDSYINGDTSSAVKYNISQSAIKYDSDNDLFYTTAKVYDESTKEFADVNSKIVVKFEEQKYFKDLKFLYGAYKTELTQSEGSTSTTTEAYIRGITGESFDISDLSTSDKFVYAEEIDLRSLYTSSFNTRMFQGTKQLKAEIYGVREDGSLYISGKRNKTIGSRLYDSDFLNTIDAIIPAEVNGTAVSKLSGYTTGVDFDTDETFEAPQLVNVEIKKSIDSGYSSADDYTFKYYKNLLVFEGMINLKKSNTVQAPVDNSSAFTEVCNLLSAGDKVKGIVALSGGGYNTHTIMSTIKKRAQFFAAKDNDVMLVATDGSVYRASGVNYESVNSVSLVEDGRKIGDGSGTVLNIVWSDEYDAFLATVGLEKEVDEVYNYDYWKTSQVYALPADSTASYSTVFDSEFTTNTGLFTTNDDGVNILSGSVAEVPDVKNDNYVREIAYVNPDDIAFCSYQRDIAPTSIQDPATEYGLAYDGTYVTTSKEGPYVVREPVNNESAMETTTYRLFSDGDIDIALCQEYMFAKSYNYKVNSSTGAYLSEKTKSKHWKAVRLPVILDYTLLHLKTMNVQGANSAYNYVVAAYDTFTGWCTEDLLTKANENDTSDISNSTIVKFNGQQLEDSYTYGQLKAFIAAVKTVKDNLMTFSNFCKSVKYYAGSTAYTKVTYEGTEVSVDNTNYTAIPAAITKVSVNTKLPLAADSAYGYVIKTDASYTLTGTTDNYIIQSIAYKNYVNFEEMYYQYLYLAVAKVIGELTSQNFGTKAISDITSNNSKLYLKTITNDIISVSKSNLYKASDMRDPLNWDVAKMPTGTYVKGSYEAKAADYNLVYFNDGSTTISIPVSSKNINIYLYRLTTDIYIAPDGTHLFIGGYTVSYDKIESALAGQTSAEDAAAALEEEWFLNNVSSWLNGEGTAGSAPCIIYSDDAGQSFKVLPTKGYLDDYLFSDDSYEVSSFDVYQDSVIAYVKNQKSGGNEAKQIIISFDASSGAVDTTATDYKQVSIAVDGKVHKQELDEGYITWSDGRVGFGVDIDQSQMAGTETFNFDYTGSNVLTLPSNLTVKRVDADSFAFDKGVTAGDLTSGQVRVLISISTSNDITDPLEYLTNDTSKLYEYENKSTGYFKVPTIEEVSNYQTADRIYSSRYIDPQYDNSGDIIGYPTVDEDLAGTASMYEYELNDDGSLGSVVSLTNILGNDVKLCSEDGHQLLFSDGSLYDTEDLIRNEIDFDNAMTAGKNAVSISDAISNISKMETVEDITQSFASNDITLSKFYTDDFYALLDSGRELADMKDIFSGVWWPVSSVENAADELLSYDGGEGNSDLINFILEKEGYWNYTDNPFSSAAARFEIKDSQIVDGTVYVTVWDNKYSCYILNKRLFILGTLVVPYTFYNGGNGITVIPDPQVEYDDDYKMTGDGYLASGVYYHPMGYGGLRNNDSITDSTPWDRDPVAFENKLLKNSLGDYVHLTDEYGNLIKTYNSVQIADGTETVSYDDFLNDGDNKLIIQNYESGEITTKKYFKLTKTGVHQLHSSKSIGADSSVILRVYNNAEKATTYGIQDGKGYLYNAAEEKVCPITVEGNVLKTGEVESEDVDTSGTLYAYLTAEIKVGDDNTETENFTAEFTWQGGLLAIDGTSDDESDILYQKIDDGYIALTVTDSTGNMVKEYTYHTPTTIDDKSLLACDLTGVTIETRSVYTLDDGVAVVTGDDTFTYTKDGTSYECTVMATSKENISNASGGIDIKYALSVSGIINGAAKELYTTTYTDYGSEGVSLINAFLNGTGITSNRNGTNIVVGVTVGMTEFNKVIVSYNGSENIYCPVFITEDLIYRKATGTDSNKTIYAYYLGDAELDTSNAFAGLGDKNIDVNDIDDDATVLEYEATINDIGVSAGDIITGLYGYCISKVPKYKTFSDLVYNLGVMIRKVKISSTDGVATHSNLTIGDEGDYYFDERDGDDLAGIKISAVADDGSEVKLASAPSILGNYDDHKEHYFLFKILTIAHQNVAAANMNNEEFFREVSISEMSTFPPDRVWYNPKGTPVPPITVGEVILNEANNYAYYSSDYVNANRYKIRICDEYGRYINYTTSGESYRLDSDGDGDCSEYVYSGYDGRYVSPEPVNATCQEWYKENMWAKNKDVNPLWQIIHIVPKIENKVWTQDISLKRYEKSGNNQVLVDAADSDAYLSILPITSITAFDNIISYDNDSECFNLTKGTLQLLLSEGSSYYKENTEVTKYGLHFDTSNIANMYTNEEFSINSTLQASYTVNSARDFTTSVQENRDIVQVTELGIFDKNHKLIAYANFPPVEYRTSSQHLAFTCVIYYGNMVKSQ